MKYKILFNGKNYIVKIKTGLFWRYIKRYYLTGCDAIPIGSYIIEFISENEAIGYVEDYFDKVYQRVREYRVI